MWSWALVSESSAATPKGLAESIGRGSSCSTSLRSLEGLPCCSACLEPMPLSCYLPPWGFCPVPGCHGISFLLPAVDLPRSCRELMLCGAIPDWWQMGRGGQILPERRDLETQQLPAATLKMPEVQGMGMFSGCGSTDRTIVFTVPISCLPGMLLFSKMFTQTLGSSFFSRRTGSKVYPYIFGALCVTWSKSLKSQFIQKGAQSFHQA